MAGVPRKVHEEIKFFARKGHEVYAIAERIDREAIRRSGGIPLKTLRWPFKGFARRINYMKRAHAAIERLKPDLVIGHGDIINQDIAYIHNCVHLAYEKIHGEPMPEDHEVGRIHRMILTQQKFKVLVCNSKLMRNELINRFKIPEDKVEVIYPEYSPAIFNTEPRPSADKRRRELGFSKDEVVIGFISSGNFQKRNLTLLIETVALLKKQTRFNFKVLVAGKDRSGSERERIHRLGLKDMFVFAPAIEDVQDYYHMSDIFVMPAHIEEFGRCPLEAMACGRPVITTDMAGSSELLEGESRDFILREKTREEFAQKLKILFEDKDLRIRLGALNAQSALKNSDSVRADDFALMLEKYGFDF